MTKRTILKGAAILAVAGAVWGCKDGSGLGGSTGSVAPVVELDGSVHAPRSRAAAEVTAPDAADLSLRLTAADGSMSREWNRVGDFDRNAEFKVGSYTLEAWHGTEGSEGFDCPYFYGTATFRIKDGETTPVNVTATVAQALVSVEYTEAFQRYMTAWGAKVNTHLYTATETRPVFVQPGTVAVYVDFTKPNGKSATGMKAAEFTASAQTHYTVTVDVNGGEAGDATLAVTYSDDMEDVDVTIDISDKVLDAPAPTLTPGGFASGDVLTMVQGMPFSADLGVTLEALGGIGAVNLTTASASLLAQGWPASIDLMQATPAQQAAMTNLGLEVRGIFRNPDKFAVIDFTGVTPHIGLVNGDNTSTFTLTATDRYGRTTEAMTLGVTLEPLDIELAAPNAYSPGEPLDVEVVYNGNDIEDYVTIQYRNALGNWRNAPEVTYAAKSRAATTYVATVTGLPADMTSVTLRAVCAIPTGNVNSNDATAKPVDFGVAVDDNDVFATHATVRATALEDRDPATLGAATFSVSTDGTTYTTAGGSGDGNGFTISGLTPGTRYYVKAHLDGLACKPVEFTTEEALQIPNGNFESAWTKVDGASNWENMSLPGWGTNNPMTTSQGSNYAYCRISGTIQAAGSNGNGVVIRTVGWGSGNSATGSGGGSGATKYVDAGLLHLGSSRSSRPVGYSDREGALTTDDLECGIDFASRPSSLSFKYTYANKNANDKGLVEYWVKDAAGNILASGSQNLNPTSSFTEVTVPMTYTAGAPKGARLYVKFLSTNDRSFLQKNNDNLSGPGFGNLSRGTFMGSQLTIDEVTLNY